MNVLIACEESQVECVAFRDRGFNAFSCDIQKTSGPFPEYHIWGDVSKVLHTPCFFYTQNGALHCIEKWDLVIAHPPCTFFCRPQVQYITPTSKKFDPERLKKVEEAKRFFMSFLDLDTHVAVENPVPLSIVGLPVHSACVQPYEFGHEYSKLTYFWLKKLPPLFSTCICNNYCDYVMSCTGGVKKRSKLRSKSFPGIAKAMAEQWGDYVLSYDKNKKRSF